MNWDDVARACLALPGTAAAVSASGRRRWLVRGRTFIRERPLHRVDLAELGDAAPTGPILVAYVPDEGAKAALTAAEPDVYFTTSHFDGVPIVQCRLEALDERSLTELVGEAWACRAPVGSSWSTARQRIERRRPTSYRARMATWADVSGACTALPEVAESTRGDGLRQWRVRDKLFVWERPLRRSDLAELGDDAPAGPVLGARVPDEGAKRALVEAEPRIYFTTHHFDGYPAVLVRLDELDGEELTELVEEAWACRAPRRLVAEHPLGPR